MSYLGLNREKKKMIKPSEKFKNIFNFEWDTSEDTSFDINPLYYFIIVNSIKNILLDIIAVMILLFCLEEAHEEE